MTNVRGTIQKVLAISPSLVRMLNRPLLFLLLVSVLLSLHAYRTVAQFRSLPSPLFGGDLYYQQGSVEHIMAGGNPLASSSIRGGIPGYLPLYPSLVAVFAVALRLSAYDGLRYFSVIVAFLMPWAWRLTFTRVANNAWWSVIGALAVVFVGATMSGLMALPVMKYGEFVFAVMFPLFLYFLHRACDDFTAGNAGLLAFFYALLTLSHMIVFIGASIALLVVLFGRIILAMKENAASSRAPRGWARPALVFAAVSLPVLLVYWYRPIFVHHLSMPYDRVHIDYADYGVSRVRLDFLIWSARDLFFNFSDLDHGIRSILFLFAFYSLVRNSGRLFADKQVAFLGSLWVASVLATFSFFITEPVLGMNFIPPYMYGIMMPPAFILPAIYFLDRAQGGDQSPRYILVSLAIAITLTALIFARYESEQQSNKFFKNSYSPLPDCLVSLSDYVKRNTDVNDVVLSAKELGFMLNGLTGRKLVTNRWVHQNDPYLNMPERDLLAAVILYGNERNTRIALIRQLGVKYLYWDVNWAATEYQVTQDGRVTKIDPLNPLDSPGARALLDRQGVRYRAATTWLDPAVGLPDYRQYRALLIGRDNYSRPGMPWEPGLDDHLEEVWACQENGMRIAALYKIR